MKLGVFGGTFDPPHIAHLVLAAEACAQIGLDRLLWVLTPDPPHKYGRAITIAKVRQQLLQAAISGNSKFELSTIDIDRPPPHFAIDTLRIVKELYPSSEIYYLMGGDSLRDLPSWHRPKDIVAACQGLVVMQRFGARINLSYLERKIPGISARIEFLNSPRLEISALGIRQRIKQGLPFRYFIPPAVYSLIVEMGLYK